MNLKFLYYNIILTTIVLSYDSQFQTHLQFYIKSHYNLRKESKLKCKSNSGHCTLRNSFENCKESPWLLFLANDGIMQPEVSEAVIIQTLDPFPSANWIY